MTYSVQTASDMNDIPALIAAFAAARGWTVNDLTITRPGGGRAFTLYADKTNPTVNGRNSPHRVGVRDSLLPADRFTWVSAPQIGGTWNPAAPLAPTKLHLFGNDAPYDEEGQVAPWIGVVIEFGYNHYRHLYLGNMVKFGDYEGGEVISGNYFRQSNTQYWETSVSFNDSFHKYLFCSGIYTSNPGAPEGANMPVLKGGGGVNIEHPDNAVPWRRFGSQYMEDNNFVRNLKGDVVLGGIKDVGLSGGLLYRGVSDYAGADILIPYNLIVPDGTKGADYRLRPIGFPAGPRAIDMRNIQSEASISVGNRNWRVFGEFQRNIRTTVSKNGLDGLAGTSWDEETSYYVGVAYPETDS